MLNLRLLLLLIFAACCAVTQAQVNPFDLKHKLTKEELAADAAAAEVVNDMVDDEVVVEEIETTEVEDDITAVSEVPEEVTPVEDNTETALVETTETPPPASATEIETETVEPTNELNKAPPVVDEAGNGKKKPRQPLFLFLMLLAAIILSTLTISSNKSLVNNILRAVLNDNYLNLMYREQKKSGAFHYYVLYFVFIVNAGLFLYFLLSKMVFGQDLPLLWRCVLVTGIIYAVRHIFMTYLSYVYPFQKELEQYAFTIVIFNIFLGLILLPINVFIAFSPEPIATIFLYTGLILTLIVYVFRQLRGIFISSRLLFNNKFYFFLYLCAVEIAPVMLLVRYIGAYVS